MSRYSWALGYIVLQLAVAGIGAAQEAPKWQELPNAPVAKKEAGLKLGALPNAPIANQKSTADAKQERPAGTKQETVRQKGEGGGGGPVATVTKISVAAPGKVASGSTFTFTAMVTGGTPTDNVQLYDSGVAIGTAVAVSGGTATLISPALSVGMHSISAHYAGDAYNTQASHSGPLNVTVTGNTSVAITTSPTATPVAPALNVTIN